MSSSLTPASGALRVRDPVGNHNFKGESLSSKGSPQVAEPTSRGSQDILPTTPNASRVPQGPSRPPETRSLGKVQSPARASPHEFPNARVGREAPKPDDSTPVNRVHNAVRLDAWCHSVHAGNVKAWLVER